MANNNQKVFDSCSILFKSLIPEADNITFDTYSEPLEVPRWRIFGYDIGTKVVMHLNVRITVSSGDIKVVLNSLPAEMFNSICDVNELADIIKEKLKAAKYLEDKEKRAKEANNV